VSFLRRFPDWGRYGLSGYYARDDAEVDDLAADPSVVTPGRFIVVGSGVAWAVAQVVDIEDGVVHVRALRGSVASNAHMLADHHLAS